MARKHLKVRAALDLHRKVVKIAVLEQSHIVREFGNTSPREHRNHEGWDSYETTSFVCGSVALISHPHKDINLHYSSYVIEKYRHWVFLATGIDQLKGEATSFEVPLEIWPQIKAAIIAYNEWGEKQ